MLNLRFPDQGAIGEEPGILTRRMRSQHGLHDPVVIVLGMIDEARFGAWVFDDTMNEGHKVARERHPAGFHRTTIFA
jgi:hypothetical protein